MQLIGIYLLGGVVGGATVMALQLYNRTSTPRGKILQLRVAPPLNAQVSCCELLPDCLVGSSRKGGPSNLAVSSFASCPGL